MHMLHTRRKAEIEVIASSTSTSPLFAFPLEPTEDQLVTDQDFSSHLLSQGHSLHSQQPGSTALLVRYLGDKISSFVHSHA